MTKYYGFGGIILTEAERKRIKKRMTRVTWTSGTVWFHDKNQRIEDVKPKKLYKW